MNDADESGCRENQLLYVNKKETHIGVEKHMQRETYSTKEKLF